MPGQDYATARYYSAGSGSFWSPDPGSISTASSVNPTSWNRYAYGNGDPINGRDPSGRFVIVCDDPTATSIYDGSCHGDDGGGGGWDVCGGDEFDPSPSPACYAPVPPPPAPPAPSCKLSFEYRGLYGVGALSGVAAHGYLDFTAADGSNYIIEGQQVSQGGNASVLQTCVAASCYPNDHPSTDPSAGSISGPQVCDWFTTILQAATQIDQANIAYNANGPNSNSALNYILQQLPSSSWYTVPYYVAPVFNPFTGGVTTFTFGLIGFYTSLPGLP
jgi:RHS repeat-associated protein